MPGTADTLARNYRPATGDDEREEREERKRHRQHLSGSASGSRAVRFFASLPRIRRPNFGSLLRIGRESKGGPGRRDQTLRQEVKGGANGIVDAPSVQTFDSPRERSTTAPILRTPDISSSFAPSLLPPPPHFFSLTVPRPFSLVASLPSPSCHRAFRRLQEKRPRVILKNESSVSAVGGRYR